MSDWDFRDAPVELKAQYYIPFVVAPLSFFSSICVSYLILRPANRKNLLVRPRDQLLLGMSFLDILGSFGLSFSTSPGPAVLSEDRDTHVLPTYGTVQTCTAQGFFVHMGIGVPLYNAAICIYCVLSIRYGLTDRTLMRRFVPIAHCFNICWPLGTGIAALFLKLFNFAGFLGCWIGRGDRVCTSDPEYCDRGQNARSYEIWFALAPVSACFGIVVLSMIGINWTVRRREVRNRRWDFVSSAEVRTSPPTPQNEDARRGRRDQDMPLTRKTMEIGLLYSGAFLIVYLPLVLTSQISPDDVNESFYRTLRVLAVFFFPLQGFLNMLIFTSDVWIRWLKTSYCFRRLSCSRYSSSDDGQNAAVST